MPPASSDWAMKRVAGFLAAKNKAKPFLENLIKKQGRPAWKGALVFRGSSSYSARSSADSAGNATIVVVPLVLDSTHYVHSMLICKLETDTVLIKLVKARDYDTYSFNNSASVTAQDIARQFMILENTTFNHARFKITDSRLFPHVDSNGRHPFKTIYKFSPTAAASARGLTLSCYTTYEEIEYWVCPFGNGEGDHNCGYDYFDHKEVVPKTTCFWLENGTGSGSGGGDGGVYTGGGEGGGGGSGGDGGATTPGTNDPCAVNGQPATTLCGGGWEPVEDVTDENGFYYSRIEQLDSLLRANKFAIEPCDSLTLITMQSYGPMYQDVASAQMSPAMLTRLDSISNLLIPASSGGPMAAFQQTLDNASGPVVNCDFFPIRITQLPAGYTASSLLEYFRTNIDSFSQPAAGFMPYLYSSTIFGPTFYDSARFFAPYQQSVGALIHILITGNDGTVMQTEYQQSYAPLSANESHSFMFTTLQSPLDGAHPVAGNRRFGIYNTPSNPNEYTFYTMGVDRTWDWFDGFVNSSLMGNNIFNGADALWNNMQEKMMLFINSHGGQATPYAQRSYIARPKWDAVQQYLKKQISLQDLKTVLGC